MLRIEYLSDRDQLENESEVLGWLRRNEAKILQVQMYLAKAPKVKIDEQVEANYAASILISEELMLSIRKDVFYIDAVDGSGTIEEVSFDSDNHLRVKKDAW